MLLDCEFIRALVVANELSPARSAMRALEPCCIYVTTHADPHAALETARSKTFDVAVLDVELLGREVGPQFASFRVIPNLCMVALTTSDDASERVRWLEAGADECITLPCESQELMARMRATVRCAHRDHFRRHRTLQVGRLSLSLESMCAEINGSRLELTTYEFALLWALVVSSIEWSELKDCLGEPYSMGLRLPAGLRRSKFMGLGWGWEAQIGAGHAPRAQCGLLGANPQASLLPIV